MKLQYFIPPALICALLAALYYHAPTARIGQPENASAPSTPAATQRPTQPENTHPAQRQPENEYSAFRQNQSSPSASTPPAPPIVQAARSQIGKTLRYDPAYTRLAYPMGDVPLEKGVCTDVVIRALRQQNMNLQALVHRDMKSHFADYPRRWGLKQPDPNIDHRRVPNLIVYFTRQGWATRDNQYCAGDIVTWELNGNRLPHIGIVSNRKNGDTPLIIHNIGAGVREDDILFKHKITGYFRQPEKR